MGEEKTSGRDAVAEEGVWRCSVCDNVWGSGFSSCPACGPMVSQPSQDGRDWEPLSVREARRKIREWEAAGERQRQEALAEVDRLAGENAELRERLTELADHLKQKTKPVYSDMIVDTAWKEGVAYGEVRLRALIEGKSIDGD